MSLMAYVPQWLTGEVFTRVALPLTTFFLGVLFTLILKRYERKKDTLRQHAENISTLVNDWYNQLHEIRVELKGNSNHKQITKEVYFYVNNRLILPKLLLSLNVLKEHKASRSLVREAEDFLRLVTDYNPEEGRRGTKGAAKGGTKCVDHLGGNLQSERSQKSFDNLLSKLDIQLQKVTQETAKVLK